MIDQPIRFPGQLRAPPPLALYIHLPWCVQKCPYCDFNSHVTASVPEAEYLDALERDLIAALPQVWGREIVSVFIGGGTPSLFSAAGIDRLLTQVRTLLRVNPAAEITLEANPGSFEVAKFEGFRAAGVNRVSLGIQSFDDTALKRIGRVHDGEQARRAAAAAREIFDNLNLDLIYALPEQDEAAWRRDLDTALAFAPDHLSAYHLTLEPNTAFGHTPPANLPDDDTAAAMQEQAEATLAAAGFVHYETSAFARPYRQSQHNLNYWQFGDYLGIGAGAHSKLSLPTGMVRQARTRHPAAYMSTAGTAAAFTETAVARKDLPFEFMMNALRLLDGADARLYLERTGLPLPAGLLQKARERGLLSTTAERLAPTPLGQRFLNDLLEMFLAD
ncbi:MAG: oxygen-independent coproporphyrinogen III oxidase-like protein [Betaproteobacteria bacterium]|nr:MAG: oxygen-independent coproporphyrinogen III oxidase-like protein [Betaproteobacteria bacterium]